jgi:hypothetical protein
MFDWEKAPGKSQELAGELQATPQPAAFHHKGMRLHQKKYDSPLKGVK